MPTLKQQAADLRERVAALRGDIGLVGRMVDAMVADLAGTRPPPPVDRDLFRNPFNMHAIHHRPIGRSVQYGLPPSILIGQGRTDANLDRGVRFTGTNEAAARGRLTLPDLRLVLQQDPQTRKYMTRVKPTDPQREVRYTAPGGGGTRTIRMPPPGDGCYYPPDSGTGEGQPVFWPRNGGPEDIADTWTGFHYNSAGTFADGNLYKSWPLGFVDQFEPGSPGDDGTSASNRRWPGGLLRGHEVNGDDPGPIEHSFTCTLTRQGGVAPFPFHLLSRRLCFPAYGIDSAVDDIGVVDPNDNKGDIPYGACMTFTPEGYAQIKAAIPATNKRGHRVIDAIYFYGMYADDGGGVQQTIAIRCDAEVGYDGSTGRKLPGVRDDIESALAVAASKLWPVFNPPTYSNRAQLVGAFPFVGGGGPRDPANPIRSRNSAYDAPSPGYPT